MRPVVLGFDRQQEEKHVAGHQCLRGDFTAGQAIFRWNGEESNVEDHETGMSSECGGMSKGSPWCAVWKGKR